MRLTVLGCSGTFPGPDSPCSSYLVEHGGFRLLLDAGNGSIGVLQRVIGLLDLDAVLVTHLHGDHYVDLVPYTYARRYHPQGTPPPLPLYGPPGTREALVSAFRHAGEDLVRRAYDLHTIGVGELAIGPLQVRTARMNHPVETYGVRLTAGDRSIAYSADTARCATLVDLARDVDLMVCEASFRDGDDNPPGVHLTGREAGEHATRAGAHRLLLTHLVPWCDPAAILQEARGAFAGDVELARSCGVLEP